MFFFHYRYLFRSGNIETSTDKFYNTTVEVQPANVSNRRHTSQFPLRCCLLNRPSGVRPLAPPVCTSLCVHVIGPVCYADEEEQRVTLTLPGR